MNSSRAETFLRKLRNAEPMQRLTTLKTIVMAVSITLMPLSTDATTEAA